MTTFRALALGVIALAAASCSDSLSPFPDVVLRTEAAPSFVSAGDTLTMWSILQNTSAETIAVGSACGPPTLFELRHNVAGRMFPIDPANAVFTCEGSDWHTLEPLETDTVRIRWRVTGELVAGVWEVRSGFRHGIRLVRLTEPVIITVQPAVATPASGRR